MESLTRFRRHPSLNTQRQQLAAPQAMPMPGLPAPGTGATLVVPTHNYPAPGPTVLGFCYANDLLLNTAIQSLDTTAAAASAAALAAAQAAQITANTAEADAVVGLSIANAALPMAGGTMSGNLRVNAGIGINQAPISGHGLDYAATNLRVSMTGDFASWQNNMGLVIDKTSKASTQSQCVIYGVAGKQCWAAGMDVSTNTSGNGGTGNGDFVPVFDATAGWNDDGTRSVIGGGADIFRFTPSEEAAGGKSTTWDLNGAQGANKNTTNVWGLMTAGKNLSGVKLSINADNSRAHMILEQRASTHQYAAISLNQRWIIAQDITATNAPAFTFYDSGSSASSKSRMYIEATNNEQAKVGFNTISPVGLLSVSGDALAAHYDVGQSLLVAGYSNALNNRSISLQQLLNASAVKNYLLLNGTLGTGTVGSPTLTSAFAGSMGLESSDTELAVVYAAQGTNVALSKATRWNVNGNMGFFGVTPVARPTITGSRASGAALADLLTKLALTGLIADGTSA